MAKFFALALLSVYITVFAAVSAEEKKCHFKELLKESIDACKDKISEENLNLLKENEEADNEEIRCFQACIIKHAGFLKEGKFDLDLINSKIDEAINDPTKSQMIKSVVENCTKSAEGAGNDCEIAGSYSQCFIKAKKAHQAEQQ